MHTEPAAKCGSDNAGGFSTAGMSSWDAEGNGFAAPNHSHNPSVLRNREAAIGTE